MHIEHPIRDRLTEVSRRHLIADVVKQTGRTEEDATKAVAALETKRPLLELLLSFDWSRIIDLAIALLPLLFLKEDIETVPCDTRPATQAGA